MDILKKIIIVIFFLFALILLFKVVFLETYPDFEVYYSGSSLLLQDLNPYIRPQSAAINYVYPPFTVLFFTPFILVPLHVASKIWTVLSLLFLFASVVILARILSIKMMSHDFLLIMTLVMFSFPVKFTFGMGQINLFILFLVLLGIYYLQQKKENLSGIFFGVAIVIKFFPLLLLPYFMMKKRWTLLFFTIVTVTTLWLFSLVFVSSGLQFYFFKHVLPGILHASQTAYYNQALSGVLARSFGNGGLFEAWKLILTCALVIASFGVLLLRNKKKHDTLLEISMLLTLSLMINSFSWQHHFVWLIFPFVLLFREMRQEVFVKKFLLFAAFVLVAGNIKNPNMLPIILQSHVFYGTFILWILHIHLLRSKHV